MKDSGFFYSLKHFSCTLQIQGQRFLTKEMLTCFCSSNGDFFVRITGSIDINYIDIITGDKCLPIRHNFGPPELRSGQFYCCPVPSTEDSHLGSGGLWEEHRQCPVGVAVGFSHEFVTDHANAKFAHHTPPKGTSIQYYERLFAIIIRKAGVILSPDYEY
ncbi:hypothetical protein D3C72_604060 [compost metagenome]